MTATNYDQARDIYQRALHDWEMNSSHCADLNIPWEVERPTPPPPRGADCPMCRLNIHPASELPRHMAELCWGVAR